MRWNRPDSLGKTVEAKARNRPVKIAYLVPTEDTADTHMILDAVFFESYTRWGGVYTLIVPTTSGEFLAEDYGKWLKFYDPDFVYSYVGLDAPFVDTIDNLCCPIALLKHEIRDQTGRETTWRNFLPDWHHYIQAVSSISCIQSPSSYPQHPHEDRAREITVFTQYRMEPTNRFLADNFGTGLHTHNVTYPIAGFFRTLCLVPETLPERENVGSERCVSQLDAFRAISDRKATAIARLATVNSAGMPRFRYTSWSTEFLLIVGDTPLDRINFWNSRHLGASWNDAPNSMIVSSTHFDDEDFVKGIGTYLNHNNFLGGGNGPRYAMMFSASVPKDRLEESRRKLQYRTYNSVQISRAAGPNVLPSARELDERIQDTSSDSSTLKLTEDFSEATATEPAHFLYVPPQLRGWTRGQWIVELDIQRHNNLSRFSNVTDSWTLPKRRKIARAFTERLAKPTNDGRLALVPLIPNFPFGRQSVKNPLTYEITLPSDDTFFRHLALAHFQFPADDLREANKKNGYLDLAISNKGRNLRGVISLFDDLHTAYEILTNKYWRTILAKAKQETKTPRTFTWNQLSSVLPNDRETIQRLTEQLRFDQRGKAKKYLQASLKDTLEHLVRLKVIFQVAHWRCTFCGHTNSRSFDKIKLENDCDVCATRYLSPIDIEWRYELSEFVHRSLQTHFGLPVLWTLGALQDRMGSGSFWYLPEVDLFESDDSNDKNEIDILCMLAGEFVAVEVKQSATSFLNDSEALDKFVEVAKKLRPDVAMLSFQQYCPENEDSAATKARLMEAAAIIRGRIGPWIKLELLVAQDTQDFGEFTADLGWYGPRVREFND